MSADQHGTGPTEYNPYLGIFPAARPSNKEWPEFRKHMARTIEEMDQAANRAISDLVAAQEELRQLKTNSKAKARTADNLHLVVRQLHGILPSDQDIQFELDHHHNGTGTGVISADDLTCVVDGDKFDATHTPTEATFESTLTGTGLSNRELCRFFGWWGFNAWNTDRTVPHNILAAMRSQGAPSASADESRTIVARNCGVNVGDVERVGLPDGTSYFVVKTQEKTDLGAPFSALGNPTVPPPPYSGDVQPPLPPERLLP
jgi:hypothetical protein